MLSHTEINPALIQLGKNIQTVCKLYCTEVENLDKQFGVNWCLQREGKLPQHTLNNLEHELLSNLSSLLKNVHISSDLYSILSELLYYPQTASHPLLKLAQLYSIEFFDCGRSQDSWSLLAHAMLSMLNKWQLLNPYVWLKPSQPIMPPAF